jgi:zinc-ribbon domain
MEERTMAIRQRPSTGAVLATVFVVLATAYALLLFVMFLTADIDNAKTLRSTAVFLLILSGVAFGALLFSGAVGDHVEETGERQEPDGVAITLPDEVVQGGAPGVESTAGCPNCGQVNPAGANFCNACGTRLVPDSEGGKK